MADTPTLLAIRSRVEKHRRNCYSKDKLVSSAITEQEHDQRSFNSTYSIYTVHGLRVSDPRALMSGSCT